MIIENTLSSLLALLLAATSSLGFSPSILTSATPRASAQVNGSVETNTPALTIVDWARNKPSIVGIDPTKGPVETKVTLTGRKFTDDSIVRFGKGVINDTTVSDDGKTLSFIVPDEMDRYCVSYRMCPRIGYDVTPGKYTVRVQNGTRTSNTVRFEVTEPDTHEPLVIEDISGPVALETGEAGTWTVDVQSEADGNLQYSVKWGDEAPSLLRMLVADEKTQSSATFSHIYDTPGTYHPEFTVTDTDGHTVAMKGDAVVVSDEVLIPHIDSVSPSSGAMGSKVTVMGSGFSTDSTVKVGGVPTVGVTFISDTKLTFTVPNLSPTTYAVTVSDNDGTSNSVNFIVTKPLGKISITGIDAPNRLSVDTEGTWTVHASSNMSGNLKYSVDWGEATFGLKSLLTIADTTQSSATLTHAYTSAGTYHPKFTVTDENGRSASVSASVVVTGLLSSP